MSITGPVRDELSTAMNEAVTKCDEGQNGVQTPNANKGDSVHDREGRGVCVKKDIENMDTFDGFEEASMKMRDGLSEVLSRLNKRLDKITNDMIRNYLREMTSETEKQILADSRIQRDIAEKIHQLEVAFDKALHIDGLMEPANEVETSDETSGEAGDDLFESIDDTSDIEEDITDCSNFSTDVDSKEEFIEFEDATDSKPDRLRETLPAPPVIPKPVEKAQEPQSNPQGPLAPTFSRIVSPDGSPVGQRFPPRFNGNRIVDPFVNHFYRTPLKTSATQYVGYQAPAPQFGYGAQMPYFTYPMYFPPTFYPCFCPPGGPQRYPMKNN